MSAVERPIEILKAFVSHPFLSGIDSRLLTLLSSGAEPFRCQDGEVFARAGSEAKAFYLVQSGHVSIQADDDGAVTGIDLVGPGEVVGWSWLVPPHRWQFTCQAVGDVFGIRFNADWLRQVCQDHRELGYEIATHLLAVVTHRLTATRHALAESPWSAVS